MLPIRPDDHLRHRSRPDEGIRAGLQHQKISIHVIVHQVCALIGFLQNGVNDDALGAEEVLFPQLLLCFPERRRSTLRGGTMSKTITTIPATKDVFDEEKEMVRINRPEHPDQ